MIDTPIKRDEMDKRITLYVNESDRTEFDKLKAALEPEIIKLANADKYLDIHGKLSTAALFRYLRHQEMDKRGMEHK
jgi:hypothetical protein